MENLSKQYFTPIQVGIGLNEFTYFNQAFRGLTGIIKEHESFIS